MKGRRVRLLTIAGGGATADVAVAADVPVADLLPTLVELVGGCKPAPSELHWELHTPDGAVLRPAASLHDQDVQDGEVLHLRASRQPDLP